MATNLTIDETTEWPENIKLIDTDEPVIGGAEGTSNAQPIQLSARTQWLKAQMVSAMVAAGLTPDDEDTDQLRDAVVALITEAVAPAYGEIEDVITQAGLSSTDGDVTELYAAVQALIAAAVGQPIDIPFYAGYDSDGTGKDLVVQAYGAVVMPRDGTIIGDIGHLRTAATDADLILDIEVNGVSIFGTNPKFTAAGTTFTPGVIDGVDDEVVIDVDAGDLVEFKVTQIGSTIAGQRLCYTLKVVTR